MSFAKPCRVFPRSFPVPRIGFIAEILPFGGYNAPFDAKTTDPQHAPVPLLTISYVEYRMPDHPVKQCLYHFHVPRSFLNPGESPLSAAASAAPSCPIARFGLPINQPKVESTHLRRLYSTILGLANWQSSAACTPLALRPSRPHEFSRHHARLPKQTIIHMLATGRIALSPPRGFCRIALSFIPAECYTLSDKRPFCRAQDFS